MVEYTVFEDNEREPLLMGYSHGEPRLSEVDDNVKAVENSAHRKKFNSIKLPADEEATPEAKPR